MQRALLQYRDPQNYSLVREALLKAGRSDLIGFGPECLIRHEKKKLFGKRKERNGKSGKRTHS